MKWKTVRTALTAKSCISNKYLQQRKHATETIFSFTQQIRSISESLAGEIGVLGTSEVVCGKGRLRKWGTLYNLAMAELRMPRDVDIVQSVLQILEDYDKGHTLLAPGS